MVGDVVFLGLGAAAAFFVVVFGLATVALFAVETFVASRADRRVGAVVPFFAGIIYVMRWRERAMNGAGEREGDFERWAENSSRPKKGLFCLRGGQMGNIMCGRVLQRGGTVICLFYL